MMFMNPISISRGGRGRRRRGGLIVLPLLAGNNMQGRRQELQSSCANHSVPSIIEVVPAPEWERHCTSLLSMAHHPMQLPLAISGRSCRPWPRCPAVFVASMMHSISCCMSSKPCRATRLNRTSNLIIRPRRRRCHIPMGTLRMEARILVLARLLCLHLVVQRLPKLHQIVICHAILVDTRLCRPSQVPVRLVQPILCLQRL